MKKIRLLICCLIVLAEAAVPAVTTYTKQLNNKLLRWSGRGALGFNMNTGNTHTRNMNTDVLVKSQHKPRMHQFNFDGYLDYNSFIPVVSKNTQRIDTTSSVSVVYHF